MRGTENCREARKVREGITPAHAGNRKYIRRMNTADRDHPRTCGEQSARKTEWNFSRGSPPHMRGTVYYEPREDLYHGITPAHAGNSLFFHSSSVPLQDHPRTCGEQTRRSWGRRIRIGSPPHMRGTASRTENGSRRSEDHPRTCGEQKTFRLRSWKRKGSPPHMRGTGKGSGDNADRHGITPAHAGNS